MVGAFGIRLETRERARQGQISCPPGTSTWTETRGGEILDRLNGGREQGVQTDAVLVG